MVGREIEARTKDYARQAKIPGLPAGQDPARGHPQRFQQQVLEDVAETLVNKVVFEELEGRGLQAPRRRPRSRTSRSTRASP